MYFVSLGDRHGELVGFTMVPLCIRNFRLNQATSADAAWLGDVLTREGARLATRVRLEDDDTLTLVWR